MKKYKSYFFFVSIIILLVGSFGVFNLNSVQAYDSGCIGGGLYSITTGQYCGTAPVNYYNNYSYGCSSAGPFNTITGQICGNQQINYYNNGCSAGVLYSITTGQPCYGSNLYPVYNQAPVISGVSGPQSLSVNQSGTWVVTASNSNGGNLSYSVNWGDQQIMPMYLNNGYYPLQQSATFTHSYSQAGTYNAVFTVTNSNGQTAQTSLSVNVSGFTNYYNTPSISSITPTSGSVGTQITIYGNGFSTSGCTTGYCNNSYSQDIVNFGPSIISNAYSNNGTSLTFAIPSYTNTNSTCLYSNSSCTIPQYQIMSGTYPIFITNANGISNVINFVVTYPTR